MPEKKSFARRAGVPAALVLLSLALAAVAAEAFARAANPFGISYYRDTNRYFNSAIELPPDAARPDGRLFQHRPGVQLDFPDFAFVTDELGLRSGSTHDGVAPDRGGASAGKARILFLGDSVTLGWGVSDADTWVRTVEREGHFADGRPLECLNAGHLQYNTLQEYDWLAAFGPHLAPDAVVLTYVVNDLDDAWAVYQEFQRLLAAEGTAEGPGALERARRRVLGWFPGLHGLWTFFAGRAEAQTRGEQQLARVEDAPGYARGWELSSGALERMRAFCADRGIPFVVLDHTTPRIPDVQRWCAAAGVPWFDFCFSDAEWARDVRNSAADSHANALGNRLLADKALRALRDAGICAEGGG
jgi:lysophospholipase L1-like esterase